MSFPEVFTPLRAKLCLLGCKIPRATSFVQWHLTQGCQGCKLYLPATLFANAWDHGVELGRGYDLLPAVQESHNGQQLALVPAEEDNTAGNKDAISAWPIWLPHIE